MVEFQRRMLGSMLDHLLIPCILGAESSIAHELHLEYFCASRISYYNLWFIFDYFSMDTLETTSAGNVLQSEQSFTVELV